jgi:lia operon protein LiaF
MNPGMLKRILFGLLLIGFGLLFLASQLGFIDLDWGDIFPTFWPVILIFVGLAGMASAGRNQSGLFWNGFVALIGAVFLLRNLGLMDIDFGDIIKMVIPAAIILYGLKLILGGERNGPKRNESNIETRESKHDPTPPPPPPPPPPSVLDEPFAPGSAGATGGDTKSTMGNAGWMHGSETGRAAGTAADEASGAGGFAGAGGAGGAGGYAGSAATGATGGAERGAGGSRTRHSCSGAWKNGWENGWSETWNGVETRSGFIGDIYLGRDYWTLKPMNVNLFIGDTVIDLTKAQIPFGETRLTVSAFVGDVKVLVPGDSDLSFKVNSSSFIGDIRVFDRRTGGFLRSLDEQLPDYAEADKKIFLQCNLFIGDIQIMKVG